MSTVHTPGPWTAGLGVSEWSDGIARCDIGPTRGGLGICGLQNIDELGREASNANARLIAAAPELLEVCKDTLDDFAAITKRMSLFCNTTTSEAIRIQILATQDKLLAAIAKATGKAGEEMSVATDITNDATDWILCDERLPKEGEVVNTKIHDVDGCRNTQPVYRYRGLWFPPGTGNYVYYRPTHWQVLAGDVKAGVEREERKRLADKASLDLLDACKAIASCADGHSVSFVTARRQARAAIAKAIGERNDDASA